ncbi:MAG: hypothetical protein AOA65_0155 [Candidatus Bathyarchaeota archaeon BA1]|nr:MAG: hypothetical protein AOA65_0155 [Candidatus Bathyarchaeota archaeon BA1]
MRKRPIIGLTVSIAITVLTPYFMYPYYELLNPVRGDVDSTIEGGTPIKGRNHLGWFKGHGGGL